MNEFNLAEILTISNSLWINIRNLEKGLEKNEDDENKTGSAKRDYREAVVDKIEEIKAIREKLKKYHS